MRVEFWQPAGEHERFAPHAFDRITGQAAPFKIEGVDHGQATVVAVVVDDDGKGATWTVDIEGELGRRSTAGFTSDQGPSFSVPEIPEHWWDD